MTLGLPHEHRPRQHRTGTADPARHGGRSRGHRRPAARRPARRAARGGGADELAAYRDAFVEIAADANHEILVLEAAGVVIGVLQLSFLRCLTYRGGRRAQVEGVRIDARRRGAGLGALLLGDAIRRARERGCHLVQLTTDRQRPDARAFYGASASPTATTA